MVGVVGVAVLDLAQEARELGGVQLEGADQVESLHEPEAQRRQRVALRHLRQLESVEAPLVHGAASVM